MRGPKGNVNWNRPKAFPSSLLSVFLSLNQVTCSSLSRQGAVKLHNNVLKSFFNFLRPLHFSDLGHSPSHPSLATTLGAKMGLERGQGWFHTASYSGGGKVKTT